MIGRVVQRRGSRAKGVYVCVEKKKQVKKEEKGRNKKGKCKIKEKNGRRGEILLTGVFSSVELPVFSPLFSRKTRVNPFHAEKALWKDSIRKLLHFHEGFPLRFASLYTYIFYWNTLHVSFRHFS